jgi:hypothetical protein
MPYRIAESAMTLRDGTAPTAGNLSGDLIARGGRPVSGYSPARSNARVRTRPIGTVPALL